MHKSGGLQKQITSNPLSIRNAGCRTPVCATDMLRNPFWQPPIQWPIVTNVASYGLLVWRKQVRMLLQQLN